MDRNDYNFEVCIRGWKMKGNNELHLEIRGVKNFRKQIYSFRIELQMDRMRLTSWKRIMVYVFCVEEGSCIFILYWIFVKYSSETEMN